MNAKYYGGLDTQVHDAWIVILTAECKPERTIQIPIIKFNGYTVVDVVKTIQILEEFKGLRMVAEQIDSHNQGNKSAFTFGSAAALLGAMQEQEDIDLILVRPHVWKRKLNLTSNKDYSRVAAKAIATEIGLEFPDAALKLDSNQEFILSSNLAESLILAYYSYDSDKQTYKTDRKQKRVKK